MILPARLHSICRAAARQTRRRTAAPPATCGVMHAPTEPQHRANEAVTHGLSPGFLSASSDAFSCASSSSTALPDSSAANCWSMVEPLPDELPAASCLLT